MFMFVHFLLHLTNAEQIITITERQGKSIVELSNMHSISTYIKF